MTGLGRCIGGSRGSRFRFGLRGERKGRGQRGEGRGERAEGRGQRESCEKEQRRREETEAACVRLSCWRVGAGGGGGCHPHPSLLPRMDSCVTRGWLPGRLLTDFGRRRPNLPLPRRWIKTAGVARDEAGLASAGSAGNAGRDGGDGDAAGLPGFRTGRWGDGGGCVDCVSTRGSHSGCWEPGLGADSAWLY